MVNDKVSNLIIKLKNASNAHKESVSFPYSKFIESILELLKKENFIKDFTKKGKKIIKTVDIDLLYVDGEPRIRDVQRVSKLSRRIYKGVKKVTPVRNGFGMMVLTTPKGILSDKYAKKEGVGGEALFKIW